MSQPQNLEQPLTYNQWLSQLKQLFGPASDKIDPSIWYPYFEHGLTPRQTIHYLIFR